MRRHSNQQLMKQATEHENPRACCMRAPAPCNQWAVDMPSHKVIDGFIPRPPISPHAWAVPPFGVELAIAKHYDLRQGIQRRLKDGKEASEPGDKADGG